MRAAAHLVWFTSIHAATALAEARGCDDFPFAIFLPPIGDHTLIYWAWFCGFVSILFILLGVCDRH
jgi:hypothetical protein